MFPSPWKFWHVKREKKPKKTKQIKPSPPPKLPDRELAGARNQW